MSALTKNGIFSLRKASVAFEVWLDAESWINTTLSSPKLCSIHGNRKVFIMSRYSFIPIFKLTAMKCGLTLPSLAVAQNTTREAGFLVWKTGGTSEGSYAITQEFLRFISASTTAFPAPWCLMNDRCFGHLSALMSLALAVMRWWYLWT